MSAPFNPALETLLAETKLYRGELKGENGSWFTKDEAVATEYARRKATYGEAFLMSYQLTKNMVLVKLLDPMTRNYFASYKPSALSPYERYIEAHALEPEAYNGPPQTIIWADADGVAPEVRDLVAEHQFAGWIIGPGFRWYRTGNPNFHPEVMLLDQSSLKLLRKEQIH